MNRNDKPAGVKATPDTPDTPDNETPKAAKGLGRSNKGLCVPRTNPGQTPDTPSAASRQGSAQPSSSPTPIGTEVSDGTTSTDRPPLRLVRNPLPTDSTAQRATPAPPATPAAHTSGRTTAQSLDDWPLRYISREEFKSLKVWEELQIQAAIGRALADILMTRTAGARGSETAEKSSSTGCAQGARVIAFKPMQ
jgi:hypothetical protein